jgi:hypothetical protein
MTKRVLTGLLAAAALIAPAAAHAAARDLTVAPAAAHAAPVGVRVHDTGLRGKTNVRILLPTGYDQHPDERYS